ncbi:hypothetical protein I6E62_06945 [Niallia circulans]|nr:hypothetical protein [Niallia circulans]
MKTKIDERRGKSGVHQADENQNPCQKQENSVHQANEHQTSCQKQKRFSSQA